MDKTVFLVEGGRKLTELFGDERLDYIVSNSSLKIIQSPSVFSYSLDAVLLAHFAHIPITRGKILELCSGNGIIPILLSMRTQVQIDGLEIQDRLHQMARRNIALNELDDQVTIYKGDLKEVYDELKQSHYDSVICNPPYFPTPHKNEHNENEHYTIARHEVLCTLDDVVKACKRYVKPGGKVTLVHRPERLVDLISYMKDYRIEPKRMRLVYPKKGKEANTLLIEGIRDGKQGLKIESPLFVYEADGRYTKEARQIIYGT